MQLDAGESMTTIKRRANVSIIAVLLICVVFVAIAAIAFNSPMQNALKYMGIIADPKAMTFDKSAAIMECNTMCSYGDRYSCNKKYTVRNAEGKDEKGTETCGDFLRRIDNEKQGNTIVASKLSLSGSETFMPCGVMTVTVNDQSIEKLDSIKVKLTRKNPAANVAIKTKTGGDITPETGDIYKICGPCTKGTNGKIEAEFKIPCTNPSASNRRAIEPDELYEFTITTTGNPVITLPNVQRTFLCKDSVIFQDASEYKPDGLNPGGTTRVVFTKDFSKIIDAMTMKANVYIDLNNNNPQCFTTSSPYTYGPCAPEADVTPTATKDSSGRTIYTFTMRQIKDTNYKKDTRMVFRVLSGAVDVCHPWKKFNWHCPAYMCYDDTADGNKKKLLTAPADADGDGQVLPGCNYAISTLCDEGCYKIGEAALASPATEAACKPEDGNIWRESCYDAAYVANSNPSRCKASNLKVEQRLKICTFEPVGSDPIRCYVMPFANDVEKAKILIHEDITKFRTIVIVSYISNTGGTKVPISIENVDIKFDGKDPKAGSKYFVKAYASAVEMTADTGTSILDTYYKLEPGKIVAMESHFDMPPLMENIEPKDYELSVNLANIDVDAIPAADRTADNTYETKIRLNFDCCKDCSCAVDRCESCVDLCRKVINQKEGTFYECKR